MQINGTGESHGVYGKETVNPAGDMFAFCPRSQPPEQRADGQGGEKGGGEQPLQILNAADDAHRLPDRPHGEIAGK